jgi:HSP20 family protein
MLDLIKYDPWLGVKAAGGLGDWLFGSGLFRHRETGISLLLPRVDLAEGETEYTLTAEVPGVNPEDIQVEVEGGRLILSGRQSEEHEEEKEHFHIRERCCGSFIRTFDLPKDADLKNIVAKAKDGVLTVLISKVADRQPKKIVIKVD